MGVEPLCRYRNRKARKSRELAEIAQLVGGFSKFAARGATRRESDQ